MSVRTTASDALHKEDSGVPPQLNATAKALVMVEEISREGGPHRLGDIAARAGVGKASSHRILADMIGAGFAVSDGAGCYSSGPRLFALAKEVVEQQDGDHSVTPILARLASMAQQTVHFGLLAGREAVYVHKVESKQPFQMASRVGMRIRLYCTSIGKCILAYLPDAELRHYLDTTALEVRTPNTLTTKRALLAQLKRVRSDGYAVDNEENEQSIRCIGAPVFGRDGHVVGGVSVSTLTLALSGPEARALAPHVLSAASAVGEILGSSVRTD